MNELNVSTSAARSAVAFLDSMEPRIRQLEKIKVREIGNKKPSYFKDRNEARARLAPVVKMIEKGFTWREATLYCLGPHYDHKVMQHTSKKLKLHKGTPRGAKMFNNLDEARVKTTEIYDLVKEGKSWEKATQEIMGKGANFRTARDWAAKCGVCNFKQRSS